MSIYAGLDVSDKTTHVCVVDSEGAVLRREVLASDPDVISKWLGRNRFWQPPKITLEACCNAICLRTYCPALKHRMTRMVLPSRFMARSARGIVKLQSRLAALPVQIWT
ncbi:MAG: hypothetical protein V4461_13070 [Pseudomonadota bacterium]